MQKLLTGKKRLPGFTGEWAHMELGKYGSLMKETINPQLYSSEYFWEYSMPVFDEGRTPIKQKGADMHSNRTVICGKVLLFNKLNVRQKRIWLIDQCRDSAVCSAEFLPYKSDAINLELLSQILYTDKVTLEFIGMSTGTSNSQKRITPDAFLEYKVYLPINEKEQAAIANVFSCMDNEIEALEQKLEKTRQVKQGMMQQLLTGKIRLV
jgi:type I restriction enzyme S subunit